MAFRNTNIPAPFATRNDHTEAGWLREWREVDAVERAEAARIAPPPARRATAGFVLGLAALAALAPTLFSLSPGYSASDTLAQVIAAVVAAAVAIAVVPLVALIAARAAAFRGSGSANVLLFGAALASVGAAAIHLAVAKTHLEEYALFGVFFLLSAIAQLGWAVLVLIRPLRPLLVVGVVGNLAIAALWAVDRIWGLPLGPEHWKPDPVGFGDVAATGFELLLAVACLNLLRRRRPISIGRPNGMPGLLLLTLPVAVVAALALLSTMGIGAPVITPST